jgi:hypothetical protein
MTTWRPVQIAIVVASIAACVLVLGSATAKSVVLRGFGAPTLDGIMTSGEWDPAGHEVAASHGRVRDLDRDVEIDGVVHHVDRRRDGPATLGGRTVDREVGAPR